MEDPKKRLEYLRSRKPRKAKVVAPTPTAKPTKDDRKTNTRMFMAGEKHICSQCSNDAVIELYRWDKQMVRTSQYLCDDHEQVGWQETEVQMKEAA